MLPSRNSRKSRHSSIVLIVILLPALLGLAFCLATFAAPKDELWVKKDWTKWTAMDCDNLMHYSPWVWFDEGGGRESAPTLTASQNPNHSETLVQLRSALPVREALLKQAQMEKHYDRMDASKKQAFDLQHAADLADGDGDRIVVYMQRDDWTAAPEQGKPYFPIGGGEPLSQAALLLPNGKYLLPTQTKIILKNAAEYVFPRTLNGTPIFAEGDKQIVVVLGLPLQSAKTGGVVDPGEFHLGLGLTNAGRFTFPISSLMYKGKLEY
jgi:hypothetical protein